MNAKALALGVAAALALAACATTTSPTGRTQYVGAVSQAQLDQLGLQAFDQAKASTPLSRDASQNAYVGCVVRAITAQLPAPWNGVRWEYALFDNSEANAWALPGGKIGVYTGIFKVATTQDQLAAVIAHEIGHVTARHHDERITRQVYAQTGLGVAGALAGSRYGEGAQQTTAQLGGALLQGAFLLLAAYFTASSLSGRDPVYTAAGIDTRTDAELGIPHTPSEPLLVDLTDRAPRDAAVPSR